MHVGARPDRIRGTASGVPVVVNWVGNEALADDIASPVSAPTPLIAVDGGIDLRRVEGVYARIVKPGIDRLAAIVIGLLVLPVCVLIALAIRATMGPGVLYRQERVGLGGRSFRVYKFRTMQADRRKARPDSISFEDRRVNHKDPTDPRHTTVGRFLRKWSLDELPQLVNLLRGDMSLVGPRPELVCIVDRYEPWQHKRHTVRPGMTGLWQVSDRGDRPMHECVERDIEYVERISAWQDLKIIAKTPIAMIGSKRGH